jgi:protein ImuA
MHCASDIADIPAGRDRLKRERLAALGEAMQRLRAVPAREGAAAAAGLGWPDSGLPAELPCGALNELVADHRDRPAAFGFLFALTALGQRTRAGPAVFIAARRTLAEHGAPYGHGLAQLGLDLDRLILVETRSDKDTLWAIEETLRSGARLAVVAGATSAGLDLTSSRRLNLAAAPQRTPLILLRGTPSGKGTMGGTVGSTASNSGAVGTSAAVTRWRIAAAPAARDRFGALAAPRWRIALERCRLGSHGGRPGSWLIEWSPGWSPGWSHVAYRFRVVAGLADRPAVAGAGPETNSASGPASGPAPVSAPYLRRSG